MKVYYGGEDTVTKLIAKRLIQHAASLESLEITELEDANPRDYGTKALEKLKQMVRLTRFAPLVCVFDSDGGCVVELLEKYVPDQACRQRGWKEPRLAVNIAIDEGETWLMADRAGFAAFFGVDENLIPQKLETAKELSQSIPYKTSGYFLNAIAPYSRKKKVVETFAVPRLNRKPPTYNRLWPDFIAKHWNIANACGNSESLSRAVARVRTALREGENHDGHWI